VASTGSVLGLGRILREALRALGPHRKALWLLSALAFVQGTLETAVLYLVARLALALTDGVDTVDISLGPVHVEAVEPSTVLVVAALLLVALLALTWPLARLTGRISAEALVRARDRVIHAWFHAAFGHRTDQAEGTLQMMLGEHAQRTERLIQNVAVIIVAATSLMVLAAGTLLVAPTAAALAGVSLVVLALALRPFSRSVRASSSRMAMETRALTRTTAESVRLAQEVVAFGVTERVAGSAKEQVRSTARALAAVRANSMLAPTLYQYAALAMVLGIVALLIAADAGGDLSGAAPVILLMVRSLSYAKQLQTATQAGNEMAPFLEVLESEVADLEANPAPSGDRPLEHIGRVELRHVGFSYPTGGTVLDDVSLVLEPGEAVAVVGASGGGKTTLVQLLLRLRAPTNGTITFGDVDLQDVADADLARLIALVPQDNRLQLGTVADNIRFFRSGFSDEEVEMAARLAHVHDEVLALSEGYATLVGPGARDVSGGQRQRLGIARALLGKPELLILDEPTSALDARSEALFRETLLELKGGTTIVTVAHRPATMEVCDRIVRVERGTLREQAPAAASAKQPRRREP
jgi:ABC-type multidrug transport system fused ATPase/permease subunit